MSVCSPPLRRGEALTGWLQAAAPPLRCGGNTPQKNKGSSNQAFSPYLCWINVSTEPNGSLVSWDVISRLMGV